MAIEDKLTTHDQAQKIFALLEEIVAGMNEAQALGLKIEWGIVHDPITGVCEIGKFEVWEKVKMN